MEGEVSAAMAKANDALSAFLFVFAFYYLSLLIIISSGLTVLRGLTK